MDRPVEWAARRFSWYVLPVYAFYRLLKHELYRKLRAGLTACISHIMNNLDNCTLKYLANLTFLSCPACWNRAT